MTSSPFPTRVSIKDSEFALDRNVAYAIFPGRMAIFGSVH